MTRDELIEKLEKATGPSRELDLSIALATGVGSFNKDFVGRDVDVKMWLEMAEPFWGECELRPDCYKPARIDIPRFTSSIDAALTLESDQHARLELLHEASIRVGHRYNLHTDNFRDDAVFALAREIVISALRARTP